MFMGLELIRWWHLRKSKGGLLEVGCGTGRNFGYYPPAVTKVVAVDSVAAMVAQATKKVSRSTRDISLQVMNAHELKFSDKSFDTVVDTFGLCSYEDPIAVLKEMSRVCKQDGRILLIEHGKGKYTWINNILDKGAQRHAHNWGCIWNKDIESLVSQAGLRVVSTSRWHFGTTYVIEAKPAL
jgi:methyltransferase OMS1, mitochondrial